MTDTGPEARWRGEAPWLLPPPFSLLPFPWLQLEDSRLTRKRGRCSLGTGQSAATGEWGVGRSAAEHVCVLCRCLHSIPCPKDTWLVPDLFSYKPFCACHLVHTCVSISRSYTCSVLFLLLLFLLIISFPPSSPPPSPPSLPSSSSSLLVSY